ncbi:PTS ascorbate transporter subunit IIC [Alkalibacterium gilvum]|uniref:PTS ascorbate transporter subunit IIC n=1 Tax=Alkalibacterium gilvum TaxID=1130080 RepID=UPI003F904B5A
MAVLDFLRDILTEPAFLIGLISFVGLVAMRAKPHKVLTGTLGPILGYLMLAAGADVIVANLSPLAQMIEEGFNISGVVPNNEAIVSVAQEVLGVETMSILLFGMIANLLIARFTHYKYVFLTGHHSFFMACLLSAVLGALGMAGWELILIGGFFLGSWSAISPAIGQKMTLQVTDGDDIAMGHFSSLGYYVSGLIGKLIGKGSKSTEDIEVPEKWSFLRNTTISTAITMIFFYVVSALVAGPTFVGELAGDQNYLIYAIISGLMFAVGVAIVYAGVRMILSDLIPAFQGIATKVIPNAVPAVDCAVFFTYAPTAVIVGFISSFVGGVVGMLTLGALGGVLIIPGMVPHFFTGATAGIYGNATGGRRGAVVGAFVNGLAISFIPALLLPVLGDLGFSNTTFGDTDFGVIGILLGQFGEWLGSIGIYVIALIVLVVLLVPNFIRKHSYAINNQEN